MSGLKRVGQKAVQTIANYGGATTHAPFSIVDFAGTGTKHSEAVNSKDRKLALEIRNNSNAAVDVVLFAGALQSLVGSDNQIEGFGKVLKDGNINLGTTETPVNLTTTSKSRLSFDVSKAILLGKPSRLVSLRITAKNISDSTPNQNQFSTVLRHTVLKPFEPNDLVKEINLQEYLDEYQNQPGVITVNDGFTIDDSSVVSWTIDAQTIVGLTMYFGPQVNLGKALEKFVTSADIVPNGENRRGLSHLRFGK